MKKVVFIGVMILLVIGGKAKAQDCASIVLPRYNYDSSVLERMAPEKLSWYCNFSHNTFFETNTVPNGAVVYNLSDVFEYSTGQNLTDNFVVDLTTLSLYRYSFNQLQKAKKDETVYVRTPNSRYNYLGIRSYEDAHRMTHEMENSGRNQR